MTVPGNHPLAEILARKLSGIEGVHPKEQGRMVKRAIGAAVEYAMEDEREIIRLREALEECELEIDNYINAVYQYPTARKDRELALNPARLALKGVSA